MLFVYQHNKNVYNHEEIFLSCNYFIEFDIFWLL